VLPSRMPHGSGADRRSRAPRALLPQSLDPQWQQQAPPPINRSSLALVRLHLLLIALLSCHERGSTRAGKVTQCALRVAARGNAWVGCTGHHGCVSVHSQKHTREGRPPSISCFTRLPGLIIRSSLTAAQPRTPNTFAHALTLSAAAFLLYFSCGRPGSGRQGRACECGARVACARGAQQPRAVFVDPQHAYGARADRV
jgi:hypothetical protein